MDLIKFLSIEETIRDETYLGSMKRLENRLMNFTDVNQLNKDTIYNFMTDECLIKKKSNNILTTSNIIGNTESKLIIDDNDKTYQYDVAKNFDVKYISLKDKTCCEFNSNCLIY